MNTRIPVVSLMVAGLLAAVPAFAQDTGALLGQLRSDNGEARREAVGKFADSGAEVIGPLFDLMGEGNMTLDLTARQAVEALAYRASAPEAAARRRPVAEALMREATSDRPGNQRVFALQMLAFVGEDEVVPGLATLLADPEMHESARQALARIPGGQALKALYDALPTATPEQEVGLLNALASRAQPNMLPAFVAAAGDGDENVRVAALFALSRLPEQAAVDTIRRATTTGSAAERMAAMAAYVQLGDTLAVADQQAAARRVFSECVGSTDSHLRAAGVAGLARAGGPSAADALLGALGDSSAEVRGAAAQGLVDLKADNVVAAIAAAFAGAKPEARVTLLSVLGERGEKAGTPVLVGALKDANEAVRIAAVRALGAIGDESASGAIFEALTRASEREPKADAELDAVEWALSRIPGTAIEYRLRGELVCPEEEAAQGAKAREYTVMVRVMGNRRVPGSYIELGIMLASQTDEALRLATIEAMGRVRESGSVGALIGVLAKADSPEAKAAETALARFTSAEATRRMTEALATSPDPLRAGILRALAPREDKTLTEVFLAAARDRSEDVAVAALEGLGRLRDERAAPVFLEVAESGGDRAKQAAIRGYLSIAEARQDQDGAAALAIYEKALEIATGDEEKRTALEGIGRVGDIAQIPLVEPYLANDGLKGAAAAAIVPLAEKVAEAGDNDRAIELCRKAVDAGDRNTVRGAARRLRELGVALDVAAVKGCVTQWWVLGPFPGREKATKEDFIPTDRPVDLARSVQFGDEELKWEFAPVDDPLGLLDFEQTVARMDDCGCYAYAEVTSDQARDVLLKIGSDDSVFIWLNGKQVHAWDGNRGWGEDQDTVEAHLQAGVNAVLAKVINGGAQWSLSLRITDRDGKPIVLEQRKG